MLRGGLSCRRTISSPAAGADAVDDRRASSAALGADHQRRSRIEREVVDHARPRLSQRRQGLAAFRARSVYDFGWAELTSITAYRYNKYTRGQDADFNNLDILYPRRRRRLVQPVQDVHAGASAPGQCVRRPARLAGRRLLREREADGRATTSPTAPTTTATPTASSRRTSPAATGQPALLAPAITDLLQSGSRRRRRCRSSARTRPALGCIRRASRPRPPFGGRRTSRAAVQQQRLHQPRDRAGGRRLGSTLNGTALDDSTTRRATIGRSSPTTSSRSPTG